MTLRPVSQTRAPNRFSPCCRHPDETLPGICASCIRERLSSLNAPGSPDFRRCRSVSISHADDSVARCGEPHRRSCDVVSGRGSLSRLFIADDVKSSGSRCEARVESSNLGLSSSVTYTVIENRNEDEITVSGNALIKQNVLVDGEFDEGEFKTMKEYIDLEFGNKSKKSKDLREISGNLWGAASVFRKKLRNWRQNNKMKKLKSIINENGNGKMIVGEGDSNLCDDRRKSVDHHLDLLGRKSCDIEPRFSMDAGQIPLYETRASWDGYMIAKSIPGLAPMFSVVENGILGNMNNRFENYRLSVDGPMHSIIKDESSSGVSGLGSGHSNSDSSSSMRRSSFDRSSSVRSVGKKFVNADNQGPANVELVITARELNDCHLDSNRDDGLEKFGSLSRNGKPKMSAGWHKVCNVLGFKHSSSRDKLETFAQNCTNSPTVDTLDKQGKEAGRDLGKVVDWNFPRSRSVVGSRNSCEVMGSNYGRRSVDSADKCGLSGREKYMLEGNISPKHTLNDLDSGIVPFYMAPLKSVRSNKLGKVKLQNSHYDAGNVFHLN
ncbi:protein OCTOPUS-like [Primulina tabacum]|uniref:protein OCTOPUS-like n=1 Tax=Primulina tabacum TaxID=48773 RepID=UPI003F5AA74D